MTNLQTYIVGEDDNDIRLDRWFKRNFPLVQHSWIEKNSRKGKIKVNNQKVKPSCRVATGDQIDAINFIVNENDENEKKYEPIIVHSQDLIDSIKKSVIFKDDDIIVINKPQGLPTQGGTGIKISVDDLCQYLKFDYTNKPKLVHRLDKDTSGVLVLARKTAIASKIAKQFKNREVEKNYWALVVGKPKINDGEIKAPLSKNSKNNFDKIEVDEVNGQRAITHFEVIESISNKFSFIKMSPITGRTHQLRVHAAYMGNPIIGDGKYGGQSASIDGISKKLHLHARELKLPDYQKSFIAEPSTTMKESLNKFGVEI